MIQLNVDRSAQENVSRSIFQLDSQNVESEGSHDEDTSSGILGAPDKEEVPVTPATRLEEHFKLPDGAPSNSELGASIYQLSQQWLRYWEPSDSGMNWKF